MSGLYEQNFYGWTIEQAGRLRAGALSRFGPWNIFRRSCVE